MYIFFVERPFFLISSTETSFFFFVGGDEVSTAFLFYYAIAGNVGGFWSTFVDRSGPLDFARFV